MGFLNFFQKKASDKFIVIATGSYKDIREFYEENGLSIEKKVENFMGKSDAATQSKVMDFVNNVNFRINEVIADLEKDFIKKGIPKENIYRISETGKFYADIPWAFLIESKITDNKKRQEIAGEPIVKHINNFLKTKGYTEKEIKEASIFFPDQIAKSKDPKLFGSGAIGLSAYVVYVEIKKNDVIYKEISDVKQMKEDKLKTDIATGNRIYYAASIFSGVGGALESFGEMPIPKMILSNDLKIDVGSIRTLKHNDWNPPAYGQLTTNELKAGNSDGAKQFHKQLKESMLKYLLKQGYSQKEVDDNYRFVAFSGRGGEGGILIAVFEMNLK
jgi:SOS response regulatory protein OraA/RecX